MRSGILFTDVAVLGVAAPAVVGEEEVAGVAARVPTPETAVGGAISWGQRIFIRTYVP